ncbi:DegV family protein [Umezawaea beigongshangensis]|uniref:DegV family protein n=1 Tax=Umezawaea beigongshangensis TaxID=2780383 RepID=UPI0018F1F30A|nr:DegV family protein [Umezawaea beigongshangensis]
MYRRVAVVTDSTACLPSQLANQLDIEVVPIQVQIGRRRDDEVRIPAPEVVSAMRDHQDVSTSAPDPGTFHRRYAELEGRGVQAVVSLHLSARQSATFEFACRAAGHVNVPVHVIDTRTTGMSLGYAVVEAARAAQAGGDVSRVLAAAQHRLHRSTELIYVDTLEFLRRGGRIGTAAAVIGTALSLKPLLTMTDGQIAPLDRVIGADRAMRKMTELAVGRAGTEQVDVAVEHFGAAEKADELMRLLRNRIPGMRQFVVTEVSSAIGAHVGPGAVGITVSPL